MTSVWEEEVVWWDVLDCLMTTACTGRELPEGAAERGRGVVRGLGRDRESETTTGRERECERTGGGDRPDLPLLRVAQRPSARAPLATLYAFVDGRLLESYMADG